MKEKSKIKLMIIVVELILLIGLSGYRMYEYITIGKEESKENENDSSIEDEKNNISNEEQAKGRVKILVQQINIREEANENSADIGDALLNETYEVLEEVDSINYTWYKINKNGIVGYIANQKGENWVEYNNSEQLKKYDVIREWDTKQKTLLAFVDNSVLLIDSNGKEKSKKYDSIAGCQYNNSGQAWCDTINTNFEKKITVYEKNGKYGLLSIENGSEITDTMYEYVSIYQDNIVAGMNDLEYIIDEKGKIISKGHEKLLWFNEKIIVIEENDMIDIIDYQGNRKISSQINSNGYNYHRVPIYGNTLGDYIKISCDNNIITIDVPFKNYVEILESNNINAKKRTKYIYNIENEVLSMEEY